MLLAQLFDLLGWAGDHGATAANHHGALHQFRVREDQLDHRFARLIVARIQTELVEVLVLPNQGRGLIREQVKKSLQIGALQGILHVFDDVELDAALAQDIDCTARLPSAGIVIDLNPFHAGLLSARGVDYSDFVYESFRSFQRSRCRAEISRSCPCSVGR